MNILEKTLTLAILLSTTFITAFAQDEDMLKLLDNTEVKQKSERVIATFKESRIINAQTTETIKKGTMSFSIAHTFGNAGKQSNGGIHTFYGFDNISDVRLGFDFGITNDLTLGVGRSKQREMIDLLAKYRVLTQTIDNRIPVSVVVYADAAYNAVPSPVFYSQGEPAKRTELHRLSYLGQIIVARKFNWRFSMELLPTFQHRNYVVAKINSYNQAQETNDLFSLGVGARFKFTKRFAVIADYFYTFSDYRKNNPADPFFAPLGIGFEIETGGHVFHLVFTNAPGIIENNFIPNTTDDWLKGGFKLSFNISRVFNLTHTN